MAPGAPTKDLPLPPQKLDINPNNPLIISLANLSKTDQVLAKMVAEQVFDNCLIQAGLLDDPRSMLKRLNGLLTRVVASAESPSTEDAIFRDVNSGGTP
jgi:TNF receptor-associated protein 1